MAPGREVPGILSAAGHQRAAAGARFQHEMQEWQMQELLVVLVQKHFSAARGPLVTTESFFEPDASTISMTAGASAL